MTDTRYGNTRIGKIKAAYDDLRMAIRSGDMEASNAALDRYESWADFAFSPPPQERFIAAADALAGANEASWAHDGEPTLADIARILDALTEYRAAREAITRGTPPARECLHPYCGDVCGQEPEEDRDAYNLRVYGLREEDLP